MRAKNPLEDNRHYYVSDDTDEARCGDRPRHVASRIFEFTHVTNGRFKRVGRPGSDKQAAQKQTNADLVPNAGNDLSILGRERCERLKVRGVDATGQERDHADDEQRDQRSNGQYGRDLRGAQNAAMLDDEHHQHDGGTDEEGRVEANGQILG